MSFSRQRGNAFSSSCHRGVAARIDGHDANAACTEHATTNNEDCGMLKSDAERAIRKAIEESEAEFTEEQIKALSQMIIKISSTIVEEAFASWKPGSGGRPQFFA